MNEEKDKIIKDKPESDKSFVYRAFINSNVLFLFKKTEKIVTAVFMLTNLFEENDLLKMSLRKGSISLLKNILIFNKGHVSQKSNSSKEIKNDFIEIYSYLEISFYSGLISQMNYDLVSQEILKTLEFADSLFNIEKNAEDFLFSGDFFKQENLENDLVNNSENTFKNKLEHFEKKVSHNFNSAQELIKRTNDLKQKNLENYKGQNSKTISYKGHKNDFMSFINNQVGNVSVSGSDTQRQFIKDQKNYYTEKNLKDNFIKRTKELKTNDRRVKIMSEIENKKEVTIKDILDKFTDISEKTIQRELLKMVEDGLLVKEGERRWSKYRIKK